MFQQPTRPQEALDTHQSPIARESVLTVDIGHPQLSVVGLAVRRAGLVLGGARGAVVMVTVPAVVPLGALGVLIAVLVRACTCEDRATVTPSVMTW